MPQSYTNLVIKRQAILERLKSGQVKNFATELKKIDTLIRATFGALEENFSTLSRTRLNKLLRQLEKDSAVIFGAATENFLKESKDIAMLYMSQELLDLRNTVDLRGTRLAALTRKDLVKQVLLRPLTTDGNLLEPWLKRFTTGEIVRISNVVRSGHSQGLTNQQMVQRVLGTKARNYRDGILQTTRRNASTVVRTSVQHVASAARHEVWENNQDVVQGYKFLATLDRKTSSQCRSLDNQEFEFGKGPIPPIHPNCRSTTIASLNPKFEFLSKGRTRSGEQGPVSANTDYYDWLKDQSKADQVQVLGASRAKLFQDGGLSAERFRQLQFDKNFAPLNLSEMQSLEPEAFKLAGLN